VHVKLQPAFVLHSRPYRDSSQILDVLTAEHGRLSIVAKGAKRRQRGGNSASILQPFFPLLLSFMGRSEMRNLTAVETAGQARAPRGSRLFSAFYLNELLVRLLHKHDPNPRLFLAYGDSLQGLCEDKSVDVVLRSFELTLLRELGFGFDLTLDGHSGKKIVDGHWYRFDADYGLVREHETSPERPAYQGADLLAMAEGQFSGSVQQTAKRLLRRALAEQLGDKPLKSRDLFRTTANATREASDAGENS
jgi:DNA repair protein RecO (recombination protein O)